MPTPRPLSLIAELTHRCPLRCPYCSNPVDLRRDELDTATWLRVIDEAAALGVVQLAFTGGEPLARHDLDDLVRAAAERELYTNLITSAFALDAGRLARLRSAGLEHVQVSFQDADPARADLIAGRRAHERKLAAARAVKDAGLPLTVNVVLHRHNLDHIEEILGLVADLEPDRVEMANVQYEGWAVANHAALMPTAEQLKNAEAAVRRFRERIGPGMRVLWVASDLYEDVPQPCMGGWGRQTIVCAPDGAALPCLSASGLPGMEFPNVRDHSLEWIWERSEAFNRFRGTDWMREPCRSCPLGRQEEDYGGCRCQAARLTGDPYATDPVCEFSPHHQRAVDLRTVPPEEEQPAYVYRTLRSTTPS
ncbi:pyrroloquinoline quinone biosynthesis protein PqqE [Actinomadura sp. NPDC047616]|uniref:pyrroloquinoline quinone biosynthesis protein PqqE n=1 Tax=Actinomadura sp. NPDC047616 TaxID=3155914 RepID=UPI0033F86065